MNGINNLSRVLVEMRSMANAAQVGIEPAKTTVPGSTFGALLQQSIDGVNDLQQKSKHYAEGFERQVPGIDLADVMIADQKSSIAFQSLMQVRNKVVTAYQEVMSMPL